jgi:hypothetical protein
MAVLVALAGWPAADPPAGAWRAQLGAELPVALAVEPGAGAEVETATSSDGKLHVVVAGALANRRELEETVDRRGAAAGTRNHAAVVLRLYEGRGEQCVSALRGGFAVVVWDGRRGRLVLARDQLGVQPLYYAGGRSHCVAATALAPLLRVPDLAGTPDVALVDVLLALGTIPAPATAYPGLRQVHPGELLVWEPGRLRAQRYWQLRFPDGRDVRQTVAKEAVRRVREQLEDAVRIRAVGRRAVAPAVGRARRVERARTVRRDRSAPRRRDHRRGRRAAGRGARAQGGRRARARHAGDRLGHRRRPLARGALRAGRRDGRAVAPRGHRPARRARPARAPRQRRGGDARRRTR